MFNFPQNPQDQESFLENTIVQFSSRQGLTRYEIVSEDVYNREENMTQTQQGSNIEGFKVPKFRFVIDMRTSQSIVSDHVTRYRSSQADTSNLTQATQQTQVPSQFLLNSITSLRTNLKMLLNQIFTSSTFMSLRSRQGLIHHQAIQTIPHHIMSLVIKAP